MLINDMMKRFPVRLNKRNKCKKKKEFDMQVYFSLKSMHIYNQILHDTQICVYMREKMTRGIHKAAYARVSGHCMAGSLKRRVLSRVKRA